MTLNDVFCEQIRLKPCEARSHFEVVDPGVWRIDRAGMLVGLGDDWAGPFCLRLDGVDYEAYGLEARLATSQRQFLEDFGISFDGGMEVAKLLRMGVIAVVVLAVVGVLVFMLFRPHQPSSAAAKQSDVSGVDELFARAEARRVKNHLPGNSSKVVTLDELKSMATKRNVGTASLKERARAAFQAGKWAEAIPLVDQLTEETVDADLMRKLVSLVILRQCLRGKGCGGQINVGSIQKSESGTRQGFGNGISSDASRFQITVVGA